MAVKIMLDAGHYTNYNQSSVYKKYYEGNMAWKLCKYLKEELESYGFVVGTTRKSRDTKALDLVNDRGCKAKGYDVFISLHSNACDTESTDRVVIIKGYNQSDTLAKKLGKALTDLMGVKQNYQVYTRQKSNGDEWYGVLRGAKLVGVKNRFILEHGFYTNTKTAKWLYKDENLKKIAKAEAKVLADYYGLKKTETENTYEVTANSLNVRSGRGTENEIIGSLKKGEKITIWEISKDKKGADWASFRYSFKPDLVGFVSMKYLKKIS